MNKSEALALLDYVISVLDSCKSLEEAKREVMKLRTRVQVLAWDELLKSIR